MISWPDPPFFPNICHWSKSKFFSKYEDVWTPIKFNVWNLLVIWTRHRYRAVDDLPGGGFNHFSLFFTRIPIGKIQFDMQFVSIFRVGKSHFSPVYWLHWFLGATVGNPDISEWLHPGRWTWNLQINHLERKMIFQTSMMMFHINLPGCSYFFPHIHQVDTSDTSSFKRRDVKRQGNLILLMVQKSGVKISWGW